MSEMFSFLLNLKKIAAFPGAGGRLKGVCSRPRME
jgi:hypothetical protein